jgi:hypothetical protein
MYTFIDFTSLDFMSQIVGHGMYTFVDFGLAMTLKIDYYYYYERYSYHLANLKYFNFNETIDCYFLHIILLDILCKI